VMKQGQRLQPPEALEDIKKRTAATVASLSDSTRQLNDPTPLPVEISEVLQELTQATRQRHKLEASSKR